MEDVSEEALSSARWLIKRVSRTLPFTRKGYLVLK